MKQDLIMEYFKKEKEKGMRQSSELLEKKNGTGKKRKKSDNLYNY